MSIFDKALPANKPKTIESKKIAYMYAGILIIFAVCQLYSFDKFLTLVDSFWMPGGRVTSNLIASFIVTSEVLSLPFLLQLKLSKLMRYICMIFSWLVPIIWLGLSIWLNTTVNAVSNIGFLGTVIALIPGWWAVFISVALGMLAVWASWGMWPYSPRNTKTVS